MNEFNPEDYKIKKDSTNDEKNEFDIKNNDTEIEGGRYERDASEYENLNRILYGKNYKSSTDDNKTNQQNDSNQQNSFKQQNNSEELIKFSKSIQEDYKPQNENVSTFKPEINTYNHQNEHQNEHPSINYMINDKDDNYSYSINNSIEGTDAFLFRRVVAYVLDSVMITIIRVLLSFVFSFLNFTGQVSIHDENNMIKTILVYVIFLLFVFYLPVFLFLVLKPHLNGGLTFGRKLAGIRIVGVDGCKPTLFQLTLREFLCETAIINKLFGIAFLIGLGFLYKENPRQTLFDKITKTKLVNMD